MRRIVIILAIAMACSPLAMAQRPQSPSTRTESTPEAYDYIGKPDMLLVYKVKKQTSPDSSTIHQGDMVAGFSSGSSNVSSFRINTRTRTVYVGQKSFVCLEDDVRRVELEDCVLYSGSGFVVRSGGEASFQLKEFPDNTIYAVITWPEDFGVTILECDLQTVRPFAAPRRSARRSASRR